MSAIYPVFKYRDARAAIDFLCEAFGIERHAAYEGDDGVIHHAELRFGEDFIMLGQASEGSLDIPRGGAIYIAVADPDGLHDRAKAAGAEISRGLTDQDYGSREFTAKDPEGNVWSFGTYRPSADSTG
jgi:uncharacterized glyoxalase superfamily protein PhnB